MNSFRRRATFAALSISFVISAGMAPSMSANAQEASADSTSVAKPSLPHNSPRSGLLPARLPAGASSEPERVDTIPDGLGAELTYRSQRFLLPELRGMLLVELVTGPGVTTKMPAGSNSRRMQVQGGEVAHSDIGHDMREIRWRVGPSSVLAIVGTSEVTTKDLVAAATSVAAELRPTGRMTEEPTEDAAIGAFAYQGLPGDVGTNNNMRGSGTVYTDDWGSADGANALICETCYPSRGNLIGVWQAIMWADGGYYVNSGSPNPTYQTNCDVDGAFGGKTRAVTIQWQYSRQLTSDGRVGAQTWGEADNRLRLSAAGQPTYAGSKRTLYFQRNYYYNASERSYSWSWNGSGYFYTGYENIYLTRSTSNCVAG